MGKTKTKELSSIKVGEAKEFKVESKKEALSIRSLCVKINKERSEEKLRSKIVGENLIIVSNVKTLDSNISAKIRLAVKNGKDQYFESTPYNTLHSLVSQVNSREGSNLKVTQVLKVSNDKKE